MNRLTVKYKLHKLRSTQNKTLKPPRVLFVVVRLIGKREYGYWRGSERNKGTTFTPNPDLASKYRTEQQAQANADNSMLWRYCNYRVRQLKK